MMPVTCRDLGRFWNYVGNTLPHPVRPPGHLRGWQNNK
jgi:hypothetical protein